MKLTQISKETYIFWDKKIGQGQFGCVFEGKYTLKSGNQIKCAIKIISEKSQISTSSSYFQSEINMSKKIIEICQEFNQAYTNIVCPLVEVYDVFTSDSGESCCIVMEYCNNSLQSYKQLQKGKRFTSIESISIIEQLASGLNLLHQHNIVHRDLKPDNILGIDIKGQVHFKIGDYGLLEEQEKAKSVVGTIRYMPPEIVNCIKSTQNKSNNDCNKNQEEITISTPKSDIWALGVIAHEISAGNYLFNSQKPNDVIKSISNFKNYFQIWKESKKFNQQIDENEPLTQSQRKYFSYYKYFAKISSEPLVELIDEMLKNNPEERKSAKEIYENCQEIEMSKDFLQNSMMELAERGELLKQNLIFIENKIDNFKKIRKMKFQSYQSIQNSSKESYPSNIIFREPIKVQSINERNMLLLNGMMEEFTKNQSQAKEKRELQALGNTEQINEISKDKEIESSLNTNFSCEKMLFQLDQQDLLGFNKLSNMNPISFNQFSLNFIDLFKKQMDENINLEGIIPIERIFLSDGKQVYNLEHSQITYIEQEDLQIQSFFVSFNKNNLRCLDSKMQQYKQTTKLLNNKTTSIIIQKLQIILQVAKSLQKIHQNGNFHGLLTTKSIYIQEDSTITLGYYSNEDSIINNYKHNRFKASFKSAAQHRGNTSNMQNNDLWSLGVIIHYIFTLKHLFQTSYKIRDIVLATKFNYLKIWKDCQNYQLNNNAFSDSQRQKLRQMNEIIGEVPNEEIANMISLLVVEDIKKQINISEVVDIVEKQLLHFSNIQNGTEEVKNETNIIKEEKLQEKQKDQEGQEKIFQEE